MMPPKTAGHAPFEYTYIHTYIYRRAAHSSSVAMQMQMDAKINVHFSHFGALNPRRPLAKNNFGYNLRGILFLALALIIVISALHG